MITKQKATVVSVLSKDVLKLQKIIFNGVCQVTVLASISSEN